MGAIKERDFNVELHLLRAIAIVLVVLGHALDPYLGWPVIAVAKKIIYSFHMPLFFFMTGFWARKLFVPAWNRFLPILKTQAVRLLLPYFACSLLVVAAKLVPALGLFADRPLKAADIPAVLLLYPSRNPMIVLWFVYVLFMIQVFILSLVNILRIDGTTLKGLGLIGGIAIAAAILGTIRPVEELGLNAICQYAVFVVAGQAAATVYSRWYRSLQKLRPAFALAFVLPCVAPLAFRNPCLRYAFACGGILACWALADWTRNAPQRLRDGLMVVGSYSYEIYLYSYFFQVVLRLVLIQVLGITSISLLLVLLGAGLIGPIVLAKVLLRRVSVLSVLFTGTNATLRETPGALAGQRPAQ